MKKLFLLLSVSFIFMSHAFAQSQNHDLFIVNETSGTRSFTVSGVYNIDASLTPAWEGSLAIQGNASDPKDNVLSGVLISTDGTAIGGNGSFFKTTQATDISLQNLTVSSAQITGSGAVLNAGANSLSVIKNVIFNGNYATNSGGAIYSHGTVNISSSFFQSNSAANHGGAIYGAGTINISSSFFQGSSAANSGGAIYSTGTVNISSSLFKSNSARTSGGAIYNGGTASMDGIIVFSSNSLAGIGGGGAIYNNNMGAISAESGSFVLFEYNTALSGSHGGAIFNQGQIIFDSSTFTGNSASSSGGAVSNASGGRASFNSVIFDSNIASNGGALYNSANAQTKINSAAHFLSNSAATSGGAVYNESGGLFVSTDGVSVFENNSAGVSGGAIYNAGTLLLNSAVFYNNRSLINGGGAVYSANGTADLSNVSLISNTARDGGAIYISSGASVRLAGGIALSGNSAANNGGAIYLAKFAVIDLSSANISAIGNTADEKGGFLYNDGNKITIDLDKVTLTSNSAKDGGDFYSSGGILEFSGASTISYSHALNNGGSLYVNMGMADFSNSALTAMHNSAGQDGGFIYLDNGRARFQDAYFKENTAGNYGGAIYIKTETAENFSIADNNYIALSGNTKFEGNSAKKGGAIYYEASDEDGNFVIKGGASFTGNFALEQNGGGAIYNGGNLYLTADGGDIVFTSNTANGLPNDIYNTSTGTIYINGSQAIIINGGISGAASGIHPNPGKKYGIFKSGDSSLYINGDSSGYKGNFFVDHGNVEVSSDFFTGYTEIRDGNVNIKQGGNISSGTINIIANGVMTIETTDDLIFGGTFTSFKGGGTLIKSTASTGSLTFVGNNYDITLNRRIDIYGGRLIASTGTLFTLGEQVVLHDSAFIITSPDDLYIYESGLQGAIGSTTTKTGSGTLHIIGGNRGYTGLFEQYAGKTTVESSYNRYGSMFGGVNNIYDSVLDVTQSHYTRNPVALEHNVNLFNNAVQYYRNKTIAQTVISSYNVTFYGDNSTAYFTKAREEVRKAQYRLDGTFANKGAGGGRNEVVFNDSIVTFSTSDYRSLSSSIAYVFNNSVFDLYYGTNTKTVNFDNLSLGSLTNGIIVGINFARNGANWEAKADKLNVSAANPYNLSGNKLHLYDVLLYPNFMNTQISSGHYTADVLRDAKGLTFDENNIKSFTQITPFNTFNISIDTITNAVTCLT